MLHFNCKLLHSISLLRLLLLLCTVPRQTLANLPYFFLDANMALVLVPYDVPVGTTIYRLKAADSDLQYPLVFSVPDAVGSALVQLQPYPCTVHQDFCVCDVLLRRPLEAGVTSTFRVRVRDTAGQMTTVVSKVTATQGHSSLDDTFVELIKPIRVYEDTTVNTIIKTITARRGDRNIKFDLRGTDKLALENARLTRFGAAIDLVLKQPLDFEDENLIEFNIFAEHGYRDTSVDTRNVVALPSIVLVEDIQDTAPVFITATALATIDETISPGDVIAQFSAIDGDRRNRREVRYRLEARETVAFNNYFVIDHVTGNLSVTSSLQDLMTSSTPSPILLHVLAEEVVRSVSARAALSATTRLVVVLKSRVQAPPRFARSSYMAQLAENPPLGTILYFTPSPKTTLSFEKGQRTAFTLKLVGALAERCFEVTPSVVSSDTEFDIRVKNALPLDYETLASPQIKFKVEVRPVDNKLDRPSLRSHANFTVNILDANDHSPQFDKDVYDVIVNEDVKRGTIILKVTATDGDSGENARISYSSLTGDNADSLSLDSDNGEIRVKVTRHGFDFEQQQEYRLVVRAKDEGVPSRTGTASVRVRVQDSNDNSPRFSRRVYNGQLNADGTALVQPLAVNAVDADSGLNGRVSYRISGGGRHFSSFAIDRDSGILLVRKPILLDDSSASQATSSGDPRTTSSDSLDNDIVYLQVMAFDGGSPQRSSEVSVYIYRQENVESFMSFVIGRDTDYVQSNQERVERDLSSFIGGSAEITDVAAVTDRTGRRSDASRSVVTALVRRRFDAPLDATRVSNQLSGSNILTAGSSDIWFWLLITLFLIVTTIVAVVATCWYCACCAACCPNIACYRKHLVDDDDEEQRLSYTGYHQQSNHRVSNERPTQSFSRAKQNHSDRSRRLWTDRRPTNQSFTDSRNNSTSRLRLVEAYGDTAQQPQGRSLAQDQLDTSGSVILLRQDQQASLSRLRESYDRQHQIILVPSDIGSVRGSNISRSSHRDMSSGRGGQLFGTHGDGTRRVHVIPADRVLAAAPVAPSGGLFYQLEELDDEELEQLEMERHSLDHAPDSTVPVGGGAQDVRRSPSVEVLTLDTPNAVKETLYRREGNTDVLSLQSPPRSIHKEFYIDQSGDYIERPRRQPKSQSPERRRAYQETSLHQASHVIHQNERESHRMTGTITEHDTDRQQHHPTNVDRHGKHAIMQRFADSQGLETSTDDMTRSDTDTTEHNGGPRGAQSRRLELNRESQRLHFSTPIAEETQSTVERENRTTRNMADDGGMDDNETAVKSRHFSRAHIQYDNDLINHADLDTKPLPAPSKSLTGPLNSDPDQQDVMRRSPPGDLPSTGAVFTERPSSGRPASQMSLHYSSHMVNDQVARSRPGSAAMVSATTRPDAQSSSQMPVHSVKLREVVNNRNNVSQDNLVAEDWRHGSQSTSNTAEITSQNQPKSGGHNDYAFVQVPHEYQREKSRSQDGIEKERLNRLASKKSVHYADDNQLTRKHSSSYYRQKNAKVIDAKRSRFIEERRKLSKKNVHNQEKHINIKKETSNNKNDRKLRPLKPVQRQSRDHNVEYPTNQRRRNSLFTRHSTNQKRRNMVEPAETVGSKHSLTLPNGAVQKKMIDASGDSGIGGDLNSGRIGNPVSTGVTTGGGVMSGDESNISSTLVPGVKRKPNQFLDKKSIFTIAYDDVRTDNLRSETPHADI